MCYWLHTQAAGHRNTLCNPNRKRWDTSCSGVTYQSCRLVYTIQLMTWGTSLTCSWNPLNSPTYTDWCTWKVVMSIQLETLKGKIENQLSSQAIWRCLHLYTMFIQCTFSYFMDSKEDFAQDAYLKKCIYHQNTVKSVDYSTFSEAHKPYIPFPYI